jgi:hypothetical protein
MPCFEFNRDFGPLREVAAAGIAGGDDDAEHRPCVRLVSARQVTRRDRDPQAGHGRIGVAEGGPAPRMVIVILPSWLPGE